MKRLIQGFGLALIGLVIGAFFDLPVLAQVVVNPGGGGGTTTLTIGTTPISGGATTQVLYNLAGVVTSSSGFTFDGNSAVIDNGAAAVSPFVVKDNGTAVFTIADGGTTTMTQPLRLADGSAAAPTLAFSANPTSGIYATGASFLGIAQSGGKTAAFALEGLRLSSTLAMGFTSGNAEDVFLDTKFTREAAAVMQMGSDVNGAAVNQTLKAHDGITGTDVKGATLTLAPGLGTGAAVSNPLTINRVNTKATGTTAQTYSPAIVVCPTKILSNTSATAQTIATITTTSTTGGNVTMDYTTVANNGTLQDTDSGMVKVSWNNNAGTVAATMSAVALQSDQDASGTLATTPTATVATNVVSIKFTPTWVTIVPTTVTGWALFHLATSGDTVVCQ